MRLHVIGYKGVVGGATYELLKRLGYDVTGSDKGDPISKANFYVICVPEASVEDAVKNLLDLRLYPTYELSSLVVVRSTTPIGTLKGLMEKYEVHLCHWPEHLREATALWDCYFPYMVSIGECCSEHGDLLSSLLTPIGRPVLRTDLSTSEAAKYAINCFKAMVISYWNEFYGLSHKLSFNPHQAARIAAYDPVVPIYGTILGHAYGGKCLPKDIGTLIKCSESAGYSPKLLKAIEELNEEMKRCYGESAVKTG